MFPDRPERHFAFFWSPPPSHPCPSFLFLYSFSQLNFHLQKEKYRIKSSNVYFFLKIACGLKDWRFVHRVFQWWTHYFSLVKNAELLFPVTIIACHFSLSKGSRLLIIVCGKAPSNLFFSVVSATSLFSFAVRTNFIFFCCRKALFSFFTLKKGLCGGPHLCGQLPINRRQNRFILL